VRCGARSSAACSGARAHRATGRGRIGDAALELADEPLLPRFGVVDHRDGSAPNCRWWRSATAAEGRVQSEHSPIVQRRRAGQRLSTASAASRTVAAPVEEATDPFAAQTGRGSSGASGLSSPRLGLGRRRRPDPRPRAARQRVVHLVGRRLLAARAASSARRAPRVVDVLGGRHAGRGSPTARRVRRRRRQSVTARHIAAASRMRRGRSSSPTS
jgi:hypothetical protein